MPFEPGIASRLGVFADPELDFNQAMAAFLRRVAPYELPDCDVESIDIPGPVVPVPARIYRRTDSTALRPGFLWFHGGAFVSGSLDFPEADQTAREIVSRADAVVIASHYRLCSEDVRFPAPQQDAWAALRWVVDHAAELGIDPARLFVGGGSAGATIAATLTIMERDAGLASLAGAIFAYPLMHGLPQEVSEHLKACLAEAPASMQIDDAGLIHHTNWLLDSPNAHEFPCLPGDVPDLSGLVRALVINCEYDGLRASGDRYVEQLREAGVEVVMRLEPGVPHGHLFLTPVDSPGVDATLQAMADFIRS